MSTLVLRHGDFNDWMTSITKNYPERVASNIRQGVADLIGDLKKSNTPLPMPKGDWIRSSAYDMHELRWPSLPRGRGPKTSVDPNIRVLYAYVTIPGMPSAPPIAVILYVGDKARNPARWYDPAVPAADERLERWCRTGGTYQPRPKP